MSRLASSLAAASELALVAGVRVRFYGISSTHASCSNSFGLMRRGTEIGTIKDIPHYLTIDDAANAYRERQDPATATKASE